MRKFLVLSPTICLILVFAGRAFAQDDAKAIIEKAIKAHGGKDKLEKLKKKGIQSKGKGTVHQAGGIEISMEALAQGGKFKQIIQGEINGMKFTQTTGYDGKTLWIDTNGMTMTFEDKETLELVKEQIYAEKVAGLTFLDEKGYELSALGEIKVDDKPALGVRVSSKGHKDISLYFDKDKGLLVKTETRTVPFMMQQEVTEEKVYSAYKEIEGFLVPRKILMSHDGKKFLEAEVTEVKFVEKFDDGVFAKP